MVGRDAVRLRWIRPQHRRLLPALLLGALLAALALAALRVDLIRVRYALAEVMREEKVLLEERRRLTADVRALRDPSRLAEIAKRMGFERPARVIELRAPAALDRRP
jgi:cell division protein FtsL